MKKKLIVVILMSTLVIGILSGCGNSQQENTEIEAQSEETADQESEESADQEPEELVDQEPEEEAGAPFYEEGRACLYGLDGKEIDLEAAYTNFDKALELGKTEANFYIGVLYYQFNYPERDDQKAKTYFEAAGDNPYAQILLGEQYYYGKGTEEDKVKGQELIDAVIAQGYMEGYTVSGDIANDEEDYSAAFECYNKALESEEPLFAAIAMSDIADMYWSGKGVEQDYAVAMEWYEKAGVPEKAEAAKKAAASGGGGSNDTGFIPQTYVGPNGTFVANTEEEMFEAMAKAMGAEMVTIEGDGETGGGSLAGLGVGAEVNSQ